MALGSAIGFSIRKKKKYLTFILPPVFLLFHLTYALGLIYGIVSDLDGRDEAVGTMKIKVNKIKGFNTNFKKF